MIWYLRYAKVHRLPERARTLKWNRSQTETLSNLINEKTLSTVYWWIYKNDKVYKGLFQNGCYECDRAFRVERRKACTLWKFCNSWTSWWKTEFWKCRILWAYKSIIYDDSDERVRSSNHKVWIHVKGQVNLNLSYIESKKINLGLLTSFSQCSIDLRNKRISHCNQWFTIIYEPYNIVNGYKEFQRYQNFQNFFWAFLSTFLILPKWSNVSGW